MDKPLSEKAYQKLTRELGAILEQAARASTAEKVAGYWHVGERITRERLSEEAGYHNTILREAAQDLSISARTLQRAVLFHHAYSEPPNTALTWGHYRILAPLPSKKERTFYEKKSLAESWSVRDLTAAVRADLYSGGTLEAAVLERPTVTSYVYQAESPRLVDADTLDLDIDLGFQTWTRRRFRLANVDSPEAGTPKARAAKNFVHQHLARAQTLVVRSHKVDLHGRYVADLFLSPHIVEIDECYRTGTHLNALLVEAGHAVATG